MKDISVAASWWWESTLREAKGFYDEWRRSSPLHWIQIQPKLPEDLHEAQFQRTEQRGIQMLLKAIPTAEQQALVTDRVLSSTAIIYKLHGEISARWWGRETATPLSPHYVPKAQSPRT